MGQTWEQVGSVFETASENVRAYAKKQPWFDEIREEGKITNAVKDEFIVHEETDGVITSNIKKKMSERKTFTKDELLEIHALDPTEFQVKTTVSNEWSMTNAEGEQYFNFQSKIIAEPRVAEITAEFVVGLFENVRPVKIKVNLDEIPDTYLLLPLADYHWGLNYAEDYEGLKQELKDRISEVHSEILVTLHGDFFNVDNFLNTTVRGTQVDEVDVERATEDAYSFMVDILKCCLKNSPYVKLVYLPGNHASMVDYMFIQGIKRLFPQVEVNDVVAEYKHAWLGEHSIFMHHGDKKRNPKLLLETIVGTFPKEWGEGKTRYLITGHLHHEMALSNAGMTHYQVSSPSKLSSYDKQQGYGTSEDGQMVFEFDDVKRRAIYYL